MSQKRFLVDFVPQSPCELVGAEHNHLASVLRLRVGQQVILNNGDGSDYHCTIKQITKNSTILSLDTIEQNRQDSSIIVDVYQCMPRDDKLELIVQKLTELGISSIIPVVSQYSEQSNRIRYDRLNRIATEATKQCGRSKSLQVLPHKDFGSILSDLQGYDSVVFPYEGADSGDCLQRLDPSYSRVALLVGSEGGFSGSEVAQLADIGVHGSTLGYRILRTETAAVVVSGLIMYKMKQFCKE